MFNNKVIKLYHKIYNCTKHAGTGSTLAKTID